MLKCYEKVIRWLMLTKHLTSVCSANVSLTLALVQPIQHKFKK